MYVNCNRAAVTHLVPFSLYGDLAQQQDIAGKSCSLRLEPRSASNEQSFADDEVS